MSFGAVLDALSTSGEPDSPYRAHALLRDMEQLYSLGIEDVQPNSICYNLALSCWARSSHPQAGPYAEALLSRMEELFTSGEYGGLVCPDKISYTTTIRAWGNTRRRTSIQGETVSVVQRTEEIVSKMEHMYFQEGKEVMKPDEYTYSTAIDTIGKSGEHGAAPRAEAIVRRMELLHAEGKTDVQPTRVIYTAVIDAHAKSGERGAAECAEAILSHMEDAYYMRRNAAAKPNWISYTAVIDAWAKCREEGAAKRAEAVLRRMQEKYEEGDEDVRPNAITYAVVINAYA